jgi:hypothetical protein
MSLKRREVVLYNPPAVFSTMPLVRDNYRRPVEMLFTRWLLAEQKLS